MLDLDSLEIILQPLLNFQCPSLKVVPILVRRPAERYAAIQQILHALSSVNRVLEVAESLRDRMKELSNYIHLWKSQVLNSLAPVNSLPTELFHLIFDLAVRDQPRIGEFTNVRPALTLSHVCSRWRSASLGLPQLWTTVAITNARALPMLETFFRRAMHYPLRLEAIIDDGWRLDLSSPELSASVSQLKSIFIWSPQSFQAITLPKEPFNSLETFTMRGSNNKVAPIPPQLSQIRHLHLHSVGALGKSTVTFPQLTQLELTHMRESDVRDVFQTIDAPSLGSLYLMNGKASIGVPPQPLSATKRRFPTLERLHIIYCAPEFVEWLFRDIQYPVLRIALIQMDREFESWNHHTEVLRVAFEVFLSHAPNLGTLSLRTHPTFLTSFVAGLSITGGSKAPVPRLNSVSIRLKSPGALTNRNQASCLVFLTRALDARASARGVAPVQVLKMAGELVPGEKIRTLLRKTVRELQVLPLNS